jgi:hypothetical protein
MGIQYALAVHNIRYSPTVIPPFQMNFSLSDVSGETFSNDFFSTSMCVPQAAQYIIIVFPSSSYTMDISYML